MPRLSPVLPDVMSDAQRAMFDAVVGGKRGPGMIAPDGGLIGPFNALMRNPELGDRIQRVGEALRFETSLSRRVIEVVTLVVGAHWRAQFEWWAHERLAREAGVSDAVINAIKQGEQPNFEDTSEAVAYDVVTELHGTQRVSDATYARAVDMFGETGVFEIVSLVGYYTLISVVLNTFDIPLAEGKTLPFEA